MPFTIHDFLTLRVAKLLRAWGFFVDKLELYSV